jgi:hypothetical protein
MCVNAAPATPAKQLLRPFATHYQSARIQRTALAKLLLCR